LGPQAVGKLLDLVVDRADGGDCLKAAAFAAAFGNQAAARKLLAEAEAAGAEVQEYVTELAEASLEAIVEQAREGNYRLAANELKRLQAEEQLERWLERRQALLAALAEVLKEVKREAEAERLYQQAAKLFKQKELFDVKELVQKLRSEYAETSPVLAPDREPSFKQMLEATESLGRRITVRLDGKGDFKSIQAAIDAAPVNSVIEIQDSGPYMKGVKIPAHKVGLTVRGGHGHLPLVISVEPNSVVGPVVHIQANGVTVERLVIVNKGARGRTSRLIEVDKLADVKLRTLLLVGQGGMVLPGDKACARTIEGCILLNHSYISRATVRQSILLGDVVLFRCQMEHCILMNAVCDAPSKLVNSIIRNLSIPSRAPGTRLEYCVIFGDVSRDAEQGPGCFRAAPLFRDPANLDYRLMPNSPCIGKASDGEDIGVRWTPEMLELCRIALELRRRGLIKF
jgi:hypothetical protein